MSAKAFAVVGRNWKLLLAEEGIIIVEASKETDFDYAEDLGYNIIKEKEYKTNKHVFLEPAGRKEIC